MATRRALCWIKDLFFFSFFLFFKIIKSFKGIFYKYKMIFLRLSITFHSLWPKGKHLKRTR